MIDDDQGGEPTKLTSSTLHHPHPRHVWAVRGSGSGSRSNRSSSEAVPPKRVLAREVPADAAATDMSMIRAPLRRRQRPDQPEHHRLHQEDTDKFSSVVAMTAEEETTARSAGLFTTLCHRRRTVSFGAAEKMKWFAPRSQMEDGKSFFQHPSNPSWLRTPSASSYHCSPSLKRRRSSLSSSGASATSSINPAAAWRRASARHFSVRN